MDPTPAADFVVFLVTRDSDFDCKPQSGCKTQGCLMSLIANSYVTATFVADTLGLPSLLILGSECETWVAQCNTWLHESDAKRRSLFFSFLFLSFECESCPCCRPQGLLSSLMKRARE